MPSFCMCSHLNLNLDIPEEGTRPQRPRLLLKALESPQETRVLSWSRARGTRTISTRSSWRPLPGSSLGDGFLQPLTWGRRDKLHSIHEASGLRWVIEDPSCFVIIFFKI